MTSTLSVCRVHVCDTVLRSRRQHFIRNKADLVEYFACKFIFFSLNNGQHLYIQLYVGSSIQGKELDYSVFSSIFSPFILQKSHQEFHLSDLCVTSCREYYRSGLKVVFCLKLEYFYSEILQTLKEDGPGIVLLNIS